jgi:hypothetical protein
MITVIIIFYSVDFIRWRILNYCMSPCSSFTSVLLHIAIRIWVATSPGLNAPKVNTSDDAESVSYRLVGEQNMSSG